MIGDNCVAGIQEAHCFELKPPADEKEGDGAKDTVIIVAILRYTGTMLLVSVLLPSFPIDEEVGVGGY